MDNNSPLKVVAIGGGTGLSALLEGLKPYAGPWTAPLRDRYYGDRHGDR